MAPRWRHGRAVLALDELLCHDPAQLREFAALCSPALADQIDADRRHVDTTGAASPDNTAWCMASCRSVSIQSMLDLNKWAEEGHVPKPSAGDGIAVATEGRHQENEQSDRPKEAAESYERSTARGESRTVRRTGTLFELERSRRACLGPVPELRRELLDGGGDLLDGSRLTAQ